MITISKDVKIQIEFNPAKVAAYRLIGYENRLLEAEDFKDDRKDAGEIGAGHTVTALYEVVAPGVAVEVSEIDPLKYQKTAEPAAGAGSSELLTLKLRYKQPDGATSQELVLPVTDSGQTFAAASADFQFASAVAAFGMMLRDSQHKGSATFDLVTKIAQASKGNDANGYRAEFIQLVKLANEY